MTAQRYCLFMKRKLKKIKTKVTIARVQICNSENFAISSILFAIIILQLLVIKDLFLGLVFLMLFITGIFFKEHFLQHYSICRPSDSTVSEDARIEPRLFGDSCDFGIVCWRSNHARPDLIHTRSHPHSARSHPHSARSHPHQDRSHPHSARSHPH